MSVIMLAVVSLSVVLLNVVKLSIFMSVVKYPECRLAYYCFAKSCCAECQILSVV